LTLNSRLLLKKLPKKLQKKLLPNKLQDRNQPFSRTAREGGPFLLPEQQRKRNGACVRLFRMIV
jgi:hypothetical protein